VNAKQQEWPLLVKQTLFNCTLQKAFIDITLSDKASQEKYYIHKHIENFSPIFQVSQKTCDDEYDQLMSQKNLCKR
jgi:hypothetical protein